MTQTRHIRKVAVLGSGVMGSQIAAHLVNANVETFLFDLPGKDENKNAVVEKSLAFLQKLEPAPFSTKEKANHIVAANYDQHLPKLKDCDLVIEAISERLDWKLDLYNKIAPHLSSNAILATNTSGLSLNSLAKALPAAMQKNFCGVHFFNPPRYMHLVELIPTVQTTPDVLTNLEQFLVTNLGKGVVYTKDTPNFIANRVGVFSMLSTFYHTEQFGLAFDLVDALTGPAIGRAKSATYRTADVVGLDTLGHVIDNMKENLKDDAWHKYFATPAVVTELVKLGAIGQKAGAGFFKKEGKTICVLDAKAKQYVPSKAEVPADVQAILKMKNPAEKFQALKKSEAKEAQFLWALFRDLFHYCAVHLETIASTTRDIDFAMRWGYGWTQGPFEIWQAAGAAQITQWIEEDIKAGKSMSTAALPSWVKNATFHDNSGSYAPASKKMEPRKSTGVYARQLYPDSLVGEKREYGTTVFENDGVRLWTSGDDVAVVNFKSKMNAVGQEVLEGMQRAISEAESNFKALVVWQPMGPFSAGANLSQVLKLCDAKQFDKVHEMVGNFQKVAMALKYCMVPTVAAAQGLALGGGCEFLMQCSTAVAHLETYAGLVEVGVGVLPAGGGCKEFAIRAAAESKGDAVFPFLSKYFQNIAMANVSKSAENAREMGFLRSTDTVILNSFELLYVAKKKALAMVEQGYRPPLREKAIRVAGRGGIATFKMMLVNMLEGGFISAYDYEIGSKVAHVICGGDVDGRSVVDEQWFLDAELDAFVELVKNEKTQARMKQMLETGKPLRN